MNKKLLSAALLAGLTLAGAAQAESNFQTTTGTGALTANARLDFQVTVPKILFLQVGTGTQFANNTAINQIAFVVPGAGVGDGSAVAATAASGDAGNGRVTARLVGNNGAIAFSSTTLGALNNGAAGDTISYSQIGVAAAPLTSATALPSPALVDGASTTTSITPAAGKVVNRDATWTYSYLNQTVAAPGVYGGVNAQNSRVTYTAVMP